MHHPRLTYIYMRKDSLLQSMHEAAAKHGTCLISSISFWWQRKLGFNFVEQLWYGRSWHWSQSGKGKSNLAWKKNTFILSKYNELVDILSSGMETPWQCDITSVISQLWYSPASGILPTWHKRVYTCLNRVYDRYVLCYSTYLSCTRFRHVCTRTKKYRHVHTFLKKYEHACTWYIHVYTFSAINMYVHRSDMYVHVFTSMNEFWIS